MKNGKGFHYQKKEKIQKCSCNSSKLSISVHNPNLRNNQHIYTKICIQQEPDWIYRLGLMSSGSQMSYMHKPSRIRDIPNYNFIENPNIMMQTSLTKMRTHTVLTTNWWCYEFQTKTRPTKSDSARYEINNESNMKRYVKYIWLKPDTQQYRC